MKTKILGLTILLALSACSGNPPPDIGKLLCLSTCKDGTCVKEADGSWVCVSTQPPNPVCPESCPPGTQCTDPKVGCVPIPTPPPECLPSVPWCDKLIPPANCSTPTQPCKHNPSTDPNHCELAPNCIVPVDPCAGVTCAPNYFCSNGVCIPKPNSCSGVTCNPGYVCSDGICVVVGPPPVTSCPKIPNPGSVVYLNDKRYGNGLDSTVRVVGDQEFCQMIHGVAVNDCHLEGWAKRSECEMELLHGCPIWQYSLDGAIVRSGCYQAEHPEASCDHFGDPVTRDDPQTPEFEGNPPECGNQRSADGKPMAGFFIIGHGDAYFRACKPNEEGCGPWVAGKDKAVKSKSKSKSKK